MAGGEAVPNLESEFESVQTKKVNPEAAQQLIKRIVGFFTGDFHKRLEESLRNLHKSIENNPGIEVPEGTEEDRKNALDYV